MKLSPPPLSQSQSLSSDEAFFLYNGRQCAVACAANLPLIDRLLALAVNSDNSDHTRMAKAYLRAIDSIAKYPLRVASTEEASDLIGVGDFLAHRIGAILESLEKKRAKEERAAAKTQRREVANAAPALSASPAESHSPPSQSSPASPPVPAKSYTPKYGSSMCWVLLTISMYDPQPISQSMLESTCAMIFTAALTNIRSGLQTVKQHGLVNMSDSGDGMTLSERGHEVCESLMKKWESASNATTATSSASPASVPVSTSSSSSSAASKSPSSIVSAASVNANPASTPAASAPKAKPTKAKKSAASPQPAAATASNDPAAAIELHRQLLTTLSPNITHLPFTAFTLHLLVDNRERSSHSQSALTRLLNQQSIHTDVRALSIGDFCWIARHTSTGLEFLIDCIIERKRMSDLVSSIIDGRLAEQRYRLKQTQCRRKIFIIEGSYVKSARHPRMAVPETTIDSALNALRVQHGFLVQSTNSLHLSVQFIKQLHRLIIEELKASGVRVRSDSSSDNQSQSPCRGAGELYAVFARRLRKRPVDVDSDGDTDANGDSNCAESLSAISTWATQLRMVRGISPSIAAALVDRYPSCRSLYDAYDECLSLRDEKRMLAEIQWGPIKKRRIGKAISERVRAFVRMKNYEKANSDDDEREEKTDVKRRTMAKNVASDDSSGDDDEPGQSKPNAAKRAKQPVTAAAVKPSPSKRKPRTKSKAPGDNDFETNETPQPSKKRTKVAIKATIPTATAPVSVPARLPSSSSAVANGHKSQPSSHVNQSHATQREVISVDVDCDDFSPNLSDDDAEYCSPPSPPQSPRSIAAIINAADHSSMAFRPSVRSTSNMNSLFAPSASRFHSHSLSLPRPQSSSLIEITSDDEADVVDDSFCSTKLTVALLRARDDDVEIVDLT